MAAETGMSVRTVWRWWYGEEVSPATQYALDAAASKLGIESPPRGEEPGEEPPAEAG